MAIHQTHSFALKMPQQLEVPLKVPSFQRLFDGIHQQRWLAIELTPSYCQPTHNQRQSQSALLALHRLLPPALVLKEEASRGTGKAGFSLWLLPSFLLLFCFALTRPLHPSTHSRQMRSFCCAGAVKADHFALFFALGRVKCRALAHPTKQLISGGNGELIPPPDSMCISLLEWFSLNENNQKII